MTRAALLLSGLVLFGVLATANAGGYRFGVSDQAFYVPAVALLNHPDLFPRDRALLGPQLRLWPGGRVLAALTAWSGDDQPAVFLGLYALTLAVLFASGVALARSLDADWWTTAIFLALLTLRHRIAKTGANSLEGYGHPRMLAFAIGVGVLACVVRRRWSWAIVLIALALVAHPTTGAWFAAAAAIAAAWPYRPRLSVAGVGVALLILAGVVVETLVSGGLTRMDPAWLAVLDDKDYLFPAAWPVYAWAANLLYPILLIVVARRRQRRGIARPGEIAAIAGLVGLVIGFLISVPLTAAKVAFVVQLQVNRVFWLLDAFTAIYVAWLFVDALRARRPAWRAAACGLVVAVAAARGYYVLRVEAHRPLVQMRPTRDAWVDAMDWLRAQPASWHVLADPGHAWKYGLSVRVAALRDTPLETGKDTAMALYDRGVAMRVADRERALEGFDDFSADDLRGLASRYDLNAVVEPAGRVLALPVRYRNDGFVIYGLTP